MAGVSYREIKISGVVLQHLFGNPGKEKQQQGGQQQAQWNGKPHQRRLGRTFQFGKLGMAVCHYSIATLRTTSSCLP